MAAFTVIDHHEFTGLASSYGVTGFSTAYNHLLWVLSLRSDSGSTDLDYSFLRLGTGGSIDTGTNYSLTMLNADRVGTPDSSRSTGQTAIGNFLVAGTNAEATTFGITKIWVPNYSAAGNYKQVILNSYVASNDTGIGGFGIRILAGLYTGSTDAVDSILVGDATASNYVEFSTFTLYGITGA